MAQVQSRLEAVNARFGMGELSADQWKAAFHHVLVDGHYQALKLGHERAGDFTAPDDDWKDASGKWHQGLLNLARGYADSQSDFLQGYTDDKGVYHRGWVEDLKAKDPRYFDADGNFREGSMDPRADLYVGNMRGTANEGFVDGLPDDAEIDWVLGPEQHCPDCPEYAALGPYTKDTLLAFPGDGNSACLGNCGCTLVTKDGATSFGHHRGAEGGTGDIPEPTTPKPVQTQPQAQASVLAKLGDIVQVVSRIKDRSPVDSAFTALDDMFEIPGSNASTLKSGKLPGGTLGRYVPNTMQITFDPAQGIGEQAMTIVHEIGHLVDFQLVGVDAQKENRVPSHEAKVGLGPLAKWWAAVTQTKSYDDLSKLAILNMRARHSIRNYYLTPHELWARSFTQFVGERSGSAIIQEEWAQASKETYGGLIVHWTPDDFKEVAKAVKEVLEDAGWTIT